MNVAGIHIHRGINRRFIARVRMRGCRIWTVLKTSRSERVALRCLTDKMAATHAYGRGELLFVSDWYDPVAVLEIRR